MFLCVCSVIHDLSHPFCLLGSSYCFVRFVLLFYCCFLSVLSLSMLLLSFFLVFLSMLLLFTFYCSLLSGLLLFLFYNCYFGVL